MPDTEKYWLHNVHMDPDPRGQLTTGYGSGTLAFWALAVWFGPGSYRMWLFKVRFRF
jgi:hypothetical protein